ncbi:MAG: hypothetical protein ACHBN1_12470 [Heteroscytonema crispum UTEX LB 1556]
MRATKISKSCSLEALCKRSLLILVKGTMKPIFETEYLIARSWMVELDAEQAFEIYSDPIETRGKGATGVGRQGKQGV